MLGPAPGWLWLPFVASVIGCSSPTDGKDTGETSACPADDAVYTRVVAGANGVCGLDADGWATCWGDAADGAVLDEPFVALDMESQLVCGITNSGRNVCWGADVPGASPPEGAFVEVAVTIEDSCWRDESGTVICAANPCFDEDDIECLPGVPAQPFVAVRGGAGTLCAAASTGALTCWDYRNAYAAEPPAPGGFDMGGTNVCVIADSGDVTCTGVLNGSEGSVSTYGPGPVASGPGPWRALTAGNGFGCALDADGGLACSLGMYDRPDQAVAVPSGPYLDIAAGYATDFDGKMLCGSFDSGGIQCWTWYDYAPGTIGHPCDAPWAQDPT